jgi:hypothetical protein
LKIPIHQLLYNDDFSQGEISEYIKLFRNCCGGFQM